MEFKIGEIAKYNLSSGACLENGKHGFLCKVIAIENNYYLVVKVHRNGSFVDGSLWQAEANENGNGMPHGAYLSKLK